MQMTPVCREKGHVADATGRCLHCGNNVNTNEAMKFSTDVKSLRDSEDLKKILP